MTRLYAKKKKRTLFYLFEVPKAVKFREAESKMVAWGRRKQELLFNGYKVSDMQVSKFQKSTI